MSIQYGSKNENQSKQLAMMYSYKTDFFVYSFTFRFIYPHNKHRDLFDLVLLICCIDLIWDFRAVLLHHGTGLIAALICTEDNSTPYHSLTPLHPLTLTPAPTPEQKLNWLRVPSYSCF